GQCLKACAKGLRVFVPQLTRCGRSDSWIADDIPFALKRAEVGAFLSSRSRRFLGQFNALFARRSGKPTAWVKAPVGCQFQTMPRNPRARFKPRHAEWTVSSSHYPFFSKLRRLGAPTRISVV